MNVVLQFQKFLIVTALITLLSINSYAQIPQCKTYVFQAYNESYSYLSGGTSVNLQSDDITVRFIPIGFTFMFCGNNYTQLSACSNGWISLSNSSSTAYTNSSSSSMSAMVPVLMPIFDDLYGANGGVSTYKTTGTAPNRVFTFEWKYWRPLSYTSSAQVSFQVRLYEGTNAIKFHYKKEGSSPLPSTTIGIGYSTSDYLTLPNSGTSPIPSSTSFTTNITSYPAIGQVYEWDPPVPCDPSTNLTMNSYNSQGATFSWTGVTGAGSYDYAVDNSATLAPASATVITNTTVTNGSANGLSPSTLYYLHIRTRCSSVSISQWDTISFTTLPPCKMTSGFQVTYIDSNSANFLWTSNPNVLQYQYVVNRVINYPTSGSPVNSTTTSFVSLPDTCKDGVVYYVHIRSKCVSNDSSNWSLDSFRTPIPCRRPQIVVSYLSSNNSITSWKPVPTAYNYEYYLGSLSTLPQNGTPIQMTSIQTPYLVPHTAYTMSVRCNCEYYGIKTSSEWTSVDFTTLYPTEIGSFITTETEIALFPSPVKETLYIKVSDLKSNFASLQLIDMSGKVLKHITITNENTEVNVAAMPTGMYLIKYQDDKQSKVLKFLKE